MAGDYLKKVQPGQKLQVPAAAYNAFVDAAIDLLYRRADQLGESRAQLRQNCIVPVKNATGSALTRLAIVGISTPLFTPSADPEDLGAFLNHGALVGVVPSLATHAGRFAVLLEPADVDQVALAFVAGLCPAAVNVTDETHTYAEVADGDMVKLASGATGSAAILWKEAGTGQKWAVVHLNAGGGAGLEPGTIFGQLLYWDHVAVQWKRLDPPAVDGKLYLLASKDTVVSGVTVKMPTWEETTDCTSGTNEQIDGGAY